MGAFRALPPICWCCRPQHGDNLHLAFTNYVGARVALAKRLLTPFVLAPFLKIYFMHCVCGILPRWFGKSSCHQLGEYFACWWQSAKTPSKNKFPNPYLASLCTRLCWYGKWKNGWGRPKHEGHDNGIGTARAWGRRGRHCIGTGRGAAQSQGSALHKLCHSHTTKGVAEIGRCVGHHARRCPGKCPRRSHGHFHAMSALTISKPYNSAPVSSTTPCHTRDEWQPIPCILKDCQTWLWWWLEEKGVTRD